MKLATLLTLVICIGAMTNISASEIDLILPDRITEQNISDLDGIVERKSLRILVPYAKPDFFIKNGAPDGFSADIAREYLQFLNEGRNKRDQVSLSFIPVPFVELISTLQSGRGDIAAAPFTITPERLEQVDIISKGKLLVDQIVVSKNTNRIKTLSDLAGQEVAVRRGDGHFQNLNKINEKFKNQDLELMKIIELDENLTNQDSLEMVNAEVYDYVVMDDYRAKTWQSLYENIVLHVDIPIHSGGQVGWAIRKNSPLLNNSLSEFAEKVKKGSLLGNILLNKHFKDRGQFSNPHNSILNKNSQQALVYFKKYSEQYNFDYAAIAAQAYQESRLDNSIVSSAGAIGMMQLLPSTAKDMGFNNISNMEDNVHAGVKYMAYLRDNFIKDKDQLNKTDFYSFLWAAYNAGPGRLKQLRSHAKQMGLDPNKWFNNVEYATLDKVGTEPVNYVSNIFKYYLIYSSGQVKGTEVSPQL